MITACSVCGARELRPSVTYGPIPLCDAFAADRKTARAVNAYNVDAVTCAACGHSELNVKPPEEEIYADYKYFSSNSPDLDAHFREYAGWIVNELSLKPGAVHMDVGCNDGLLLEKSRALGLKPMGIDPSPAAKHAAAKGLNVYQGYLSEKIVTERKLDKVADIVTCNNAMANIRDLMGFGKSIQRMLKDDGAFVVETLHYPMLLRNLVYEMVNHEHYHYFSTSSIGRFFERLGLELVSCDLRAAKGATMRCVARKAGHGQPRIDPVLADVEKHIPIEAFTRTLQETRSAISSMVDAARRNGPIAGFGSSAGTTILMYLLGLQDRIDFLVDDNASRHGLFAPGSAIPIISPAEYHAKKPTLTVVFAWRFADQIIQKHQSKLSPQHKFVLANTGATR